MPHLHGNLVSLLHFWRYVCIPAPDVCRPLVFSWRRIVLQDQAGPSSGWDRVRRRQGRTFSFEHRHRSSAPAVIRVTLMCNFFCLCVRISGAGQASVSVRHRSLSISTATGVRGASGACAAGPAGLESSSDRGNVTTLRMSPGCFLFVRLSVCLWERCLAVWYTHTRLTCDVLPVCVWSSNTVCSQTPTCKNTRSEKKLHFSVHFPDQCEKWSLK